MVNELTILRETHVPVQFTVRDDLPLEKGAIVELIDPNAVSGHTVHDAPVAGVVAAEKIKNDGITKVAVWERGDFKVLLSGTCNVGDALAASGNTVFASLSGLNVFGIARETGTNTQTIRATLGPYRRQVRPGP